MSDADQIERHGFGAEVGRLLDLVVHSLYSEREIFLRELVANAADATDRRRFDALTDPSLSAAAPPTLRIVPDKDAKTLRISDDGIGMTKDELSRNLGTIARSGTRAFGETLAGTDVADRPALIGQFGVGFYSAFMVADRVEVTSRKAGEADAWTWASDGRGEYTLAPAERAEPGTDIVLHIKEDAGEFLEPARLETIVRKWADHITLPITIARDGKDEPANEGTALWRKPKSEVTDEQTQAFYRHLGNYFDTPWATLHWKAEGTLEFAALLFIPGMKPFEVVDNDRASHVRLHVRRMFISADAGLLPNWLRFVQGVVDTEDLPLNVSREMLQSTPVLGRIRKALVGRVLGEFRARAKDAEDYRKAWDNFGAVLKEGVWEDSDHRADLAALLRFRSSTEAGLTSLPDYVARMKADQPDIYYIVGEDADSLAQSPHLEGLRARGYEALLLTDPIDAFWPERLATFDGKTLRSATQAKLDAEAPTVPDSIAALTATLKAALGDRVSEVRATGRLSDSAVVLAPAQYGPDLAMQRLLRRSGREDGFSAPVLEVNPSHALILRLAEADPARVPDVAPTLLDLARIQDGEPPIDPAGFARRVTDLLGGAAS